MPHRFILVVCSIISFVTNLSAAPGVLPVGDATTSFLYERMQHEQAISLSRFDYQLGPYRIDHFSLTETPFSPISEVRDYQMALHTSLGENFHAAKSSRALAREAIRGGLAFRPSANLFVYGNFVLDEERAKDPSYVGKKWRGLAGDVEQAFAFWQTEKFDLTAGRFASFWGSPNSLVLGPNVPLDGLGYSYRWGRLTLSYRLARLDPFKHWTDDSNQVIENRYFAGHRLDIHFSNKLRVGFFETVVFGGEGRQIELFYLNPLIFFHGSQVNEGSNDNTFVGFDFSLKPAKGHHLYGQILIDDMQIEKISQGDQEPNEIGFSAGYYVADLAPSLDLKFEYSRVTNWTFNQSLERNRYLYKNELIGSASGNDYDLTQLSLVRWFGPHIAASLNTSYHRQGEGRIKADWTEPWMATDGSYHESFPTGIVERTGSLSLSLRGYFRTLAAFDLEAGIDQVDNYQHLSGENRSIPFVRLTLSAIFSTIINAQ